MIQILEIPEDDNTGITVNSTLHHEGNVPLLMKAFITFIDTGNREIYYKSLINLGSTNVEANMYVTYAQNQRVAYQKFRDKGGKT